MTRAPRPMWVVKLCWPDECIIIAETRWRWWAVVRAMWLDWWTPSSYWPIVIVQQRALP